MYYLRLEVPQGTHLPQYLSMVEFKYILVQECNIKNVLGVHYENLNCCKKHQKHPWKHPNASVGTQKALVGENVTK